MKATIYLRIAQNKKGRFVAAATSRPSYESLTEPKNCSRVYPPALPTLAFALELNFPEGLLKSAEQVAARINLQREGAIVCGKVLKAESVHGGNEKV